MQAAEAALAELQGVQQQLADKEAQVADLASQLDIERKAIQEKHKAFERVRKVHSPSNLL